MMSSVDVISSSEDVHERGDIKNNMETVKGERRGKE